MIKEENRNIIKIHIKLLYLDNKISSKKCLVIWEIQEAKTNKFNFSSHFLFYFLDVLTR